MRKRKKIATIEVPLYEHGERELFLKVALVEAECGGIKMDITYSGAGLHFHIDKKYYLIHFNEIIEAVYTELLTSGKVSQLPERSQKEKKLWKEKHTGK